MADIDKELEAPAGPDPEAQAAESEATELEGGEAAAETIETHENWDKLVPELAGQYDQLSPDVRETLLLKRLSAQAGPGADGTATPTGQAGQDGSKVTPPTTLEIPTLDVAALEQRISAAINEGDGEATAKAVLDGVRYMNGMAGLVGKALGELHDKVNSLDSAVTLPDQITQALSKVDGATAPDAKVAAGIYRKGEAKSIEAALALAVYRREHAIVREADPEAKRKAAGIAATRGAAGPHRGGNSPQRIPRNEAEYSAMLREFAKPG